MARDRRDVAAVERDRSAVELVEPHDEVDERRLARAGRSHDRDRLPGLGEQRERFDERPVGVVRERDVVELDPAAHRRQFGAVDRFGALFLGVEELDHPLERRDARLEDVHRRRELREWHREVARVLDECLDLADADRTIRHLDAADHCDDRVLEVAHEHRERLHQARHELRAERRRRTARRSWCGNAPRPRAGGRTPSRPRDR